MAIRRSRKKRTPSSHYNDVREEIAEMVERLCELHDQTDPRKGQVSEEGKHNKAQRAIAIWWYVYARLMQWTQSHIIGYEMARLDPKLQDILIEERGSALDENSHELEKLGSLYAANAPDFDVSRDRLSEALEKADIHLSDATLRRIIVKLLLSTSADSSVWRFPLSHALMALNYGEQDSFVKPAKTRRRGNPYRLDWARSKAIGYVYYLVGKGIRKHIALSRVGHALAVSSETLRDWEKHLRDDEWFRFLWESAWVAGHIEEDPSLVPEEAFDLTYYGITDTVELAKHFLARLHSDYSLASIRKELREHHR